ncbi:hypothetical protein RQP50_10030 [Paenibacillus sp. chi10]|uniref:Uncharacterized protein n=1 Tax=Paenibacillus suaedae TaxID=3077233 RepID=A0AAJ2JVR5_9BACL|nr:hypothetical protein [Paenibacillus sp. chi10]MDT8976579.1 hypothetical protein [Paenibacillus sp. chi10]
MEIVGAETREDILRLVGHISPQAREFVNESTLILGLIAETIRTFLARVDGKELYFNVYGENEEVIAFIRSIGFQSDMEGYHLIYTKTGVPDVPPSQLIEKQFEPSCCKLLLNYLIGDTSNYSWKRVR